MPDTNVNKQVIKATKWSVVTEVMAKLVTPVSSMVLARLLTPEAFGVVATLTMIISFAEIFTNAGFQQYLIQQKFRDAEDRDCDTNVAFWTNMVLSFFLWGIIAIFSEPLAALVGNPGLGHVLIITCVCIPLASFSSIQMALFQKDLDFKALFYRRLVAILIPLVVTIPMALWLRSYWALVIGTIAAQVANAVLLTVKSNWRPRFYYSWERLRNMISFCVWAIINAVLVWATGYIDVFFIGVMLNEHYLGLYKTSMVTVGQLTSIITASVLPVIMPALAKVKDDMPELRRMLLRFQKYSGIILIPIGFGIYAFRELITIILLGDQWVEATPFIGLWGLMDVVVVIFARFGSNLYPAIGKPRMSVLAQVLHLVVLIPAVVISIRYGFTALYLTRTFVRIESIIVNLVMIYYCIKLRPWRMLVNVMPEFAASIAMTAVATVLLQISHSVFWSFVLIAVSGLTYFAVLSVFPQDRAFMVKTIQRLKSKYLHRK